MILKQGGLLKRIVSWTWVKLYLQDCPQEISISCFDIHALMAQLHSVQLSDANSSCRACAAKCSISFCKGTDQSHLHQDRCLIWALVIHRMPECLVACFARGPPTLWPHLWPRAALTFGQYCALTLKHWADSTPRNTQLLPRTAECRCLGPPASLWRPSPTWDLLTTSNGRLRLA